MIALLQRVTEASVTVDGKIIASIGVGLMVLVGVQKGDREAQAERMAERIWGYRMFADEQDKMNLSVHDIQGQVLLVPQFTLAADTQKGMRPSFSGAAAPEDGRKLFEVLVAVLRQRIPDRIQTGQFGADMKVALINNGPVTFWLHV